MNVSCTNCNNMKQKEFSKTKEIEAIQKREVLQKTWPPRKIKRVHQNQQLKSRAMKDTKAAQKAREAT